MANSLPPDVDLAILYLDGTSPEYFDELRELAKENGLVLVEDSRENVPYSAIAWAMPTVITVLIAAPFVKALVNRAAEDVADVVYPKLKAIFKRLVGRVLVRDRNKYTLISTSENKAKSADAIIFSIYSETKTKKRVKFIFHEPLIEVECEERVEKIFTTLCEHHSTEGLNDRISREIETTCSSHSQEAYLIYNSTTAQWEAVDLVKETMRQQSRSGDVSK